MRAIPAFFALGLGNALGLGALYLGFNWLVAFVIGFLAFVAVTFLLEDLSIKEPRVDFCATTTGRDLATGNSDEATSSL
jgi:hypothetical protein